MCTCAVRAGRPCARPSIRTRSPNAGSRPCSTSSSTWMTGGRYRSVATCPAWLRKQSSRASNATPSMTIFDRVRPSTTEVATLLATPSNLLYPAIRITADGPDLSGLFLATRRHSLCHTRAHGGSRDHTIAAKISPRYRAPHRPADAGIARYEVPSHGSRGATGRGRRALGLDARRDPERTAGRFVVGPASCLAL